MRRMFSEKQLKEMTIANVNQGIENGSIEIPLFMEMYFDISQYDLEDGNYYASLDDFPEMEEYFNFLSESGLRKPVLLHVKDDDGNGDITCVPLLMNDSLTVMAADGLVLYIRPFIEDEVKYILITNNVY